MKIIGVRTELFRANQDLTSFVLASLPRIEEESIVVISSKVVALAQGRTGKLRDKYAHIRKESKKIIKTPWAWITLTNDEWCINAGVDESNANGELILLPLQPFVVAERLRQEIKEHFHISRCGILVTDTRSVALRRGTIGRALAFAGFKPFKSYINRVDLYGRKSRSTESNIADALAASAVCVMGEGNEQIPLAVISEAPLEFTDSITFDDSPHLARSAKGDIFARVFRC